MALAFQLPRAATGLFQGRMTDMIETGKLNRARRKAYLQTLGELRQMSEKDLADIGLSSVMIRDIALQAADRVTLE
ncbi:DUF1127 domain-containing protein [Tropicimonas sp. TH_r6]|uniref:DUF1127 domain-containing protein n=1 Tax=Tropicimonas sp. TH_r6 TaxID=3082085 RepID=UPI0029534BAA|nr:DUF1127 domain-containing protein [Tropicimonas sp. TH_r6]MDV7145044.1 DUF1127 domain-containing protein [Tropicimonas sp. TH_r6]